jgi:hypothetical protein
MADKTKVGRTPDKKKTSTMVYRSEKPGETPTKKAKMVSTVNTGEDKPSKKLVVEVAGASEANYTNTYKGKSGVTHSEVYNDGYNTKRAAKPLDGSFTGSVAPMVGGDKMAPTGMATGGSRKQLKDSKRRVNSNSASPQAKRSARKLY